MIHWSHFVYLVMWDQAHRYWADLFRLLTRHHWQHVSALIRHLRRGCWLQYGHLAGQRNRFVLVCPRR